MNRIKGYIKNIPPKLFYYIPVGTLSHIIPFHYLHIIPL